MVYLFDEKNNLVDINCVVYENGIVFPGKSGTMYFQRIVDYWYPPILFVKIIDGMVIPISFKISRGLNSVELKMKQKKEIEYLLSRISTGKLTQKEIKMIENQISLIKNKENEQTQTDSLDQVKGVIGQVYYSEKPSFALRTRIGDRDYYAIVDTGANINVIKYRPTNAKSKGYITVNGVSGSKKSELIETDIEINNAKIPIDAAVIEEIKFDALLTPETISEANKKGANVKFTIQ